jgi:hypothetical protein
MINCPILNFCVFVPTAVLLRRGEAQTEGRLTRKEELRQIQRKVARAQRRKESDNEKNNSEFDFKEPALASMRCASAAHGGNY